MTDPTLILASGSPYRKVLLERLRLPFSVDSPDLDESPGPGEQPAALAVRLAREKALAVAARRPGAIVIGSDQVASLDGEMLRKPGTAELAVDQLKACSGRKVGFDTGVCVVEPNGRTRTDCVAVTVHFRSLSDAEIRRYVALDRPLDCAGSFKWESLGITLFERLETDDPTALEGLPLIALSRMLRDAGLDVLASH